MKLLHPMFLVFCLATLPGSPALAGAVNGPGADRDTSSRLPSEAELVSALLASDDARDLAFAATMLPVSRAAQPSGERSPRALFAEAGRRATDDVLVQWLAALYGDRQTQQSAARNLLRLEPGNGAAWLFTLQMAAKADDAGGVTAALRQIAAATRFDTHFADFALAWETILVTHSAPLPAKRPAAFRIDEQPLVQGIARTSALAMPVVQPFIRACKPVDTPLDAARREACIAAGRFMVGHSAEQISRAAGASILDKAEAPDRETARRTYDYLQQTYSAAFASVQTDETAYRQFAADWRETRSETAVIERLLSRAGLPMTPPAGWKPVRTDRIAFREQSVGR